MTAFYLWSGSGVAQFVQSNAYSSGDRMVPKVSDAGSNFAVARRWVWECTTAGTSAAAEPTWPASVTQDVTTVTSGTAVFTARRPGYSSGTTANWTFATIYALYVNGALTTNNDDVVYIASDHDDSAIAASVAIGAWNARWISVDRSAAPPTTYQAGAIIGTGAGAYTLNIAGGPGCHWRGITFKIGVGSASTIGFTANAGQYVEDCTLQISSTGGTCNITAGGSHFRNTWVKFAAAGQGFISCPQTWIGGGLAPGGTAPTALIQANNIVQIGLWQGLDFTAAGASMSLVSTVHPSVGAITDTKMPASWSGSLNSTASPYPAWELVGRNVGESDSESDFQAGQLGGTIVEETTLVKSGEDFSFKVVTPAMAIFPGVSLDPRPGFARCPTSGSAVTLTVDVLRDSATNLTDKDVVLEVVYPNVTGNVFASMATSAPDFFATATDLAASTASWTTTGMSNANKQKVSVTFTPTRAGWLTWRVRCFDDSTTIYVSPGATLS